MYEDFERFVEEQMEGFERFTKKRSSKREYWIDNGVWANGVDAELKRMRKEWCVE